VSRSLWNSAGDRSFETGRKLILFALAQRCLKNSVLTLGGALHEEVA
jgi:hypothetical protein